MTDYDALPPYLENAGPRAVVDYVLLNHTRVEIQQQIGEQVGFEHDPDSDRLDKYELAMILVFALAHNGEI